MSNNFKPMLAAKLDDLSNLPLPMLASPKLDGIRAVIIDGVVMSRSLKPIPNIHVQKVFGLKSLSGLDGELIVGDPCSPTVFRETTSAVMSQDGEPNVRFYVFDDASNPSIPFNQRLSQVEQRINGDCILVPHQLVTTSRQLRSLEKKWLASGYEGVMLRKCEGTYKFGRSTVRETLLLKLKRFHSSEAEILGFEEQMHNTNKATRDELGMLERSSHKAGMQGKGTLGTLKVRDIISGVEFEIGTGLDDATRKKIWKNANQYLGKLVTYTFFPSGSKDKPRFPVFQGIRDTIDM